MSPVSVAVFWLRSAVLGVHPHLANLHETSVRIMAQHRGRDCGDRLLLVSPLRAQCSLPSPPSVPVRSAFGMTSVRGPR